MTTLGQGRSARFRRGMVLIVTLWILGLLSILLLSLIDRLRLEMALTDYRCAQGRADDLLDSGLARALWAVRQDRKAEVDSLRDPWASSRPMSEEGLIPPEYADQESPAVRWQVVDEGSKLNVNTVKREVLLSLLKTDYEGIVDGDALAEYVADWIDADGQGAGEEDRYRTCVPPYAPRNDKMPILEEMLLVDGVAPWLFYGEDRDGDGRFEPNEDDGDRSWPPDNADGQIQPGLRDLLTVWGEGGLNVNTAPPSTLAAVFAAQMEPAAAAELATKIIEARRGPDGLEGTEDDTPLKSTQQIAAITTTKVYQKCRQMGAPLAVGSTAFTIAAHVHLESEGVDAHGRGLAVREKGGVRLAYWRVEQ